MGDLSTYARNQLVNHVLRGVTAANPAKVCIALFTADPTAAGIAANEVTTAQWPGYSRFDVGVLASAWSAPNDGLTRNLIRFFFNPNAGANTLDITHMAIYDAVTGGNMWAFKELVKSKRIEPGDDLSFQPSTLELLLS
ncbi:phage tail fiber protein [Comamonas thiooxydans]|uniref:phage tail fiber protein n=1 Tax=Comamonas thiooxydans TaxID=363952 RepID=UPI001CCDFAC1|nr:hypothetical protein [Comamonas thiooxydans]UBQ44581.1 hypothetical protein LCH15_26190 [Comamonas thiooxydans]